MRFTSDELTDRVYRIIKNATYEQRITKKQIANVLFSKYNPSIDRKIRDAVTELVIEHHEPICATSDQPGYYIARNEQEAGQCIAELLSRAGVYYQKIEGIKRGLKPVEHELVQECLL